MVRVTRPHSSTHGAVVCMISRSTAFFILKLLVSASILAFLFSVIDVRVLYSHISDVSIFVFIAASLLYIVATLIATLRWNVLLRSDGIRIPLQRLFAYSLSFNFYAVALPGGKIGAEAIRIYEAISDNPGISREAIIVPTLVDRVATVFSSLVVAIIFFIVFPGVAVQFPWWIPYVGIGSIAIVIAMVVLPFERLFGIDKRVGVPMLQSVTPALTAFRKKSGTLVVTVALSLIMNGAIAFAMYLFAVSLGISVTYMLMFALFSVGMVSTFIPISLAGIGVREGVVAYLLSIMAATSLEVGASVTFLALAASFSGVVAGALVEFRRHFLIKRNP